MPKPTDLLAILLTTVAAVLAHPVPAQAADNYPSRPIRLLVGFPPGGGGDAVARLMSEHMAQTLGQPFVVENRPGAGTTRAPAAAATAAPDGYTLTLAPDSVYGADKALYEPNVTYDETSFTPISRWASTTFVLAANPASGIKRVSDVVDRSRRTGADLLIGSTKGIYPDMIVFEFNRVTGGRLVEVPYKGGAQAVLAGVAGDVPVVLAVPSSVMPLVRSGRLVAIATTSLKRSSLTPDIPTLDEEGLKGFNVGYWFSLAGPAGLPPDVVQKLFDASAKALADPAVREKLRAQGYEPAPSASVDEFRAQAIADGGVLKRAVATMGLRPE